VWCPWEVLKSCSSSSLACPERSRRVVVDSQASSRWGFISSPSSGLGTEIVRVRPPGGRSRSFGRCVAKREPRDEKQAVSRPNLRSRSTDAGRGAPVLSLLPLLPGTGEQGQECKHWVAAGPHSSPLKDQRSPRLRRGNLPPRRGGLRCSSHYQAPGWEWDRAAPAAGRSKQGPREMRREAGASRREETCACLPKSVPHLFNCGTPYQALFPAGTGVVQPRGRWGAPVLSLLSLFPATRSRDQCLTGPMTPMGHFGVPQLTTSSLLDYTCGHAAFPDPRLPEGLRMRPSDSGPGGPPPLRRQAPLLWRSSSSPCRTPTGRPRNLGPSEREGTRKTRMPNPDNR